MTKKSDAPAIRFKGFSDAWEQRKVSELFRVTRGYVLAATQTETTKTDEKPYPVYSSQTKDKGLMGYYKDYLYEDAITWTTDGANAGTVNYRAGKFYCTNVCGVLLSNEVKANQMIAEALDSVAKGYVSYVGNPKLMNNVMADIVIQIPTQAEEREQLSSFFAKLDNLITLHQRKFEKLTNVKKSMLEKMFPQNGSSYPEIRFKGFTDPWEQRKLSEITDKVTEKNAGLQYVETFTNSAEFGIISQRDFFDHDIAKLGSLDGYYIVKTEDFVYNPRISTSAPVGPINRNKLGRTGVMSPLYTVFRPHDIDTTYLEYFFKCGYWHSFMNFNGDSGARSDRFSIRDNVFFQMPIPIPNIDEQRKIGELLTCLDNLITLHQRQPFLQSPPDISLIVQLTPPFYTFSWEQRKLGDMMNVTSVKRIHQSDWTDSGVRFLRARDIVAAAKNEEPDDYLYISKEKYEEYSTLSGKVGVSDLLVTGVGTIGVPYLVRNLEPLYFKDGNIIWFQNLDKIDGKFLFYSFSAEQIQGFINESAGIGTVGTYTIESGKKTPISLPNQIEQAKVGEFFQQLDNLITLHQRQTIVYAVIRSIRKVILAERQYFAPPMVRKSP